jgi:hypothetical protein
LEREVVASFIFGFEKKLRETVPISTNACVFLLRQAHAVVLDWSGTRSVSATTSPPPPPHSVLVLLAAYGIFKEVAIGSILLLNVS